MKESHFGTYLFLLLLIVAGVAVFFIFQPFLTAIIIAMIFAVLFWDLNLYLRKALFGSHAAAAIVICFLVAILIVTPVSIVVGFAVNEAGSLYHSEQTASFLNGAIVILEQSPLLHRLFPSGDLPTRFAQSFQSVSSGAVSVLSAAYQGVLQFVIGLFVLFFTLFYFLIDGEDLLRRAKRFSPLDDRQDALLFNEFISISRAMIKGTLVVAIIQGTLAGIAFFVAGVPSPVVMGIVVSVASLIPGIGTSLIWLPTGIILVASGDIWQGVFILAFGLGVISMIDNIIRPKLVGRDTAMHPLFVFFATLGGIALFGVPGLLIGPIVVSLFFALADIYASAYGAKSKE
ncbi:MAG TPA: AI-2E family transporter [Candidatus Fimivivens sp.]|nr:AI-2E family transporter [Candidatus Fimivivens sp.]